MSLQPSSEESTWIKPKELEHVVFNAPTKEELGKIENTNFYLKVGSFMQHTFKGGTGENTIGNIL